jgi:hypothetical protein
MDHEPRPKVWHEATLLTKRTQYATDREYRFLYRLAIPTVYRGYGKARKRFDPAHNWTAIPVPPGMLTLQVLSTATS